jgi:hypothetical protein
MATVAAVVASTRHSFYYRASASSGSDCFVQLGQAIRVTIKMIKQRPSDQRVAVIGTGRLSLELGGPGLRGAARARSA